MTAPREDDAIGRRPLRSTGSRSASFTERAAEGITRCTEADLDELKSFQAVSYGDRAGRVATRWVEWLYRANPYRDPEGIGRYAGVA